MALINTADKIYVGATAVSKVYAGSNLVWKPAAIVGGPPVTAGLVLWHDASQLALADGAYVNTWPSLVGSLAGTNFNVAPYRPVLRANALNDLAVVRFSPGGGLRWPNTGIDLQWTVIYVGRMWGATVGRVVSAGYPPANIAFGYHGGLEDRFYVEGWLTTGQTQTTNWKLYSGWGDGVPGAADTAVYGNGVLLPGGANGQPGSQNGGGWKGTFHLNGYSPNSGEETCECEIAEALVYNRKLPDAERIQSEDYLRAKWMAPTAPTAPDEWLTVSYPTGGYIRDDHTGEAGTMLTVVTPFTATWMGCRYAGGTTLTGYKVSIYNWAGITPALRTVTLDMTGKANGEMCWAPIEPLTLAAGDYALMLETTSGSGRSWKHEDDVTWVAAVGSHSAYRLPAGAPVYQNWAKQYVGLDLGWNT